ncbi:SRPBCC family protein [Cellulomonas marina]|uniref:Polyketide cyclase / dehydrase and lipid transport n=1 Tax=Cellulomonas marina TaxID=988821 RepID=A0A1I0VGG9_9CELL|nr:SRPBCC family protein [Cellulomonas marina]GIG27996.1 hypothetical protein Cma02nite_05960 [Cellulomonas marina]SFA75103.1 Polyketide cyclase / dehydrase and lipid transport [Cellulomonas marina]
MSRPVVVARTVALPLGEAWATAVDPRNRPRWVPLVRTAVDGLPLGVGTRVTALLGPFTARGVPGLPDRQTVETFEPPQDGRPGRAVLVRTGPVLRGATTVEVAPAGAGASTVTWSEEVHLAGPLPVGLTSALLAPVVHLVVRRLPGGLGREAARRVRR